MTLEDETNWYRYVRFINDEAAHLRLKTLKHLELSNQSQVMYTSL